MNNNIFRNFLQQVLDTIEYQGDKAAFIDHFLKNIQTQATINLITTLSQEKQIEMEQKLKEGNNTPVVIKDLLNEYFSDAQIQESFKKTTQEGISDYLKTINTSLTDNQRNSLQEIFKKINPQVIN